MNWCFIAVEKKNFYFNGQEMPSEKKVHWFWWKRYREKYVNYVNTYCGKALKKCLISRSNIYAPYGLKQNFCIFSPLFDEGEIDDKVLPA